MSEEEKKIVELKSETHDRIVLLNEAHSGGYGGLNGDYRLVTAVLGYNQCVLYEAVSGNDRYPPGRNMHVELSFEELETLLTAYTRHKAAQEEAKAKQATTLPGDDFDPFLDDLP